MLQSSIKILIISLLLIWFLIARQGVTVTRCDLFYHLLNHVCNVEQLTVASKIGRNPKYTSNSQ
jgi:hypothetical protein